MRRLTLELDDALFTVLADHAKANRRDPREQAGWMLERELEEIRVDIAIAQEAREAGPGGGCGISDEDDDEEAALGRFLGSVLFVVFRDAGQEPTVKDHAPGSPGRVIGAVNVVAGSPLPREGDLVRVRFPSGGAFHHLRVVSRGFTFGGEPFMAPAVDISCVEVEPLAAGTAPEVQAGPA